MPTCPVAVTPNKGKHYLFRWVEGGSPSTAKVAKGVDTRGGLEDKYRSHIVVFPSTVDQKMYYWENWTNDIPEIPGWITRRLGEVWQGKQTPGGGRGNENVGLEDLEQLIPVDQIKRMLSEINPDDLDYDQWLRIGLAIKSQYPEEDGLEMWDVWSRSGERYKEGECEIRWHGFSDAGTVRAGTLFWHARERGWKPEKGDKTGNTADSIVAEMNEKYAMVLIGGKLRILFERWNPIETEPNYALLEKEAFTGYLANQCIFVGSGDKQKRIPLAQIWLAHEGRRTYENGMALFPGEAAPEGYFNTWNGFSVSPKKGDPQLFLDHIMEAICCGDEVSYEWMVDWIADMFQDPGNPKGCAVVMRGPEGAGKGAVANTIGLLFGPHYRHLIDDTHLTSNFNAHMMDSIVVFADEITWGGNKKTSGKLKGLVTEQFLLGERKGIDAIPYRNMTHLMIASNGKWVIPADADSRRWFVCDVSKKFTRDRAYFNKLFKFIESPEGRSALLHYFLNKKITSDLRRAPETKALHSQQMINSASDSVLNWYRERILAGDIGCKGIRENENTKWPSEVVKMDLYESYRTRVLDGRETPVRENLFGKQMIELGLVSTRPRIKVEGQNNHDRPRCYMLPRDPDEAAILLNKAMPSAIEDDDE